MRVVILHWSRFNYPRTPNSIWTINSLWRFRSSRWTCFHWWNHVPAASMPLLQDWYVFLVKELRSLSHYWLFMLYYSYFILLLLILFVYILAPMTMSRRSFPKCQMLLLNDLNDLNAKNYLSLCKTILKELLFSKCRFIVHIINKQFIHGANRMIMGELIPGSIAGHYSSVEVDTLWNTKQNTSRNKLPNLFIIQVTAHVARSTARYR